MRLWYEESASSGYEPTLTTIQAGLMLVEYLIRDSLDFLAGAILASVITMSRQTDLDKPIPQNASQLKSNEEVETTRKKIDHARSVTAWGIFHLVTSYSRFFNHPPMTVLEVPVPCIIPDLRNVRSELNRTEFVDTGVTHRAVIDDDGVAFGMLSTYSPPSWGILGYQHGEQVNAQCLSDTCAYN
ncbi:hypothetical protein Dda_6928 [Drechslerella dactyloides]|uniref:Transcription factor domain-containing protein n=1 Tax=Drechslerella dactyloides TaxID=74499 RepID=A0AAD6IWI2_DREDA|nr:hypothetical protein Dda_6928 [Drechslerella dactyloides]